TAPVLAEVTPVPTPSNETSPSYTFSSDEAGTIAYGGVCTSTLTQAVAGDNVVTFDTLSDGTYTDCTITVSDAAGNMSAELTVSPFTIDTDAPTVVLSTTVTDPTNVFPIEVQVQFSRAVENLVAADFALGNATPTTLSGADADYVLTISPDADGPVTMSLPADQANDPVGNLNTVSNTVSFVYDGTAPVLAEVTPVPTPSNETSPSYTFSSDEAGTIAFGGVCTSTLTQAVAGDNVVTFDPLSDGSYTDCTIRVTDAVGNESVDLLVTAFTVDTEQATATLVSAVTAPTNATSIIVDVTFSKPVRLLDATDFSFDNATALELTGADDSFVLTLAPIADGNVDVTLPDAAAVDEAGNGTLASNTLSFVFDGTRPTLSEVTAIPALGRNATPSFTFNTSEAGTLSFTGACSSTITDVTLGDNTVTLETLADGLYGDCGVQVTDAVGNASEPLVLTAFTIDTTAPVLSEAAPIMGKTQVPGMTESNTPIYTFSSTQAGVITYGGACVSDIVDAVGGDNTVRFDTLPEGRYEDCTISVTDIAGNASNMLSVSPFEIDVTAPVLSEVTPVPTPAKDNQPSYTFNSTQSGMITFGGVCTSTTDKAMQGDTTVHFEPLEDGVYEDCTIMLLDTVGNESNILTVNPFEIDTQVPTVLALTPASTEISTAVPVTVEFSEPVTGFDAIDDIVVEGASATVPEQVAPFDGTRYQTTVTPQANYEGAIALFIPVGAAQDLSGNTSAISSTLTLTADTIAPSIEITAAATTLELDASTSISFTLSEASTDFDITDIRVTSGTLSEFDGAGASYTAVFTPRIGPTSNAGIATIFVAEGAFTDSFGNRNSASNELELDFGEALVERTSRIVNNFMVRRIDQVVSQQPDISGRLNRSGGNANQAGSFTGEGNFGTDNRFGFSTSLRDLAAYQQRDQRAPSVLDSGELGGFGAQPMAQTHGSVPADVWIAGSFARIENETAESTLGLLFGGFDYAVTPELVLGIMGQVDWIEEDDDTRESSASGIGWMVGPYFVAEVDESLILDGRFAWGQSDNTVSPFNTYED
ncbi:MAG: Ig-like domain-containing protein, partial [Pseudomonadota bacterium]